MSAPTLVTELIRWSSRRAPEGAGVYQNKETGLVRRFYGTPRHGKWQFIRSLPKPPITTNTSRSGQ